MAAGDERRDARSAWERDRTLILHRIEECQKTVVDLEAELKRVRLEDLVAVRIEIAKLTVKAGIWGAIGGAIPVAVGLLLGWLKRGG